MTTKPRALAAKLLQQCEASRSYANLALDAALRREHLSGPDAALCTALVYGVMERRRTLDYQLEDLLSNPLQQLPPEVRTALRLGCYQLLYMDRVPAFAAINESVELVKHSRAKRCSGLVNAVLRRVQGRGLLLPQGDDDRDLGIRYACPAWLVSLWRERYPQDALPLLEATFGTSETVLRVNTLRSDAPSLAARLNADAVEGVPHALRIAGGAVTALPGFSNGLFHVQDSAAQLCCHALDPQPGETLIDLCAAPGGKSFTCAQLMQNRGRILALDLHAHRVRLIEEGAARLGITCINAMQCDARNSANFLAEAGKAHRVLCDVPCSGLGTIGKKPDIREKIPTDLDKLPEMQYAILCVGAECLVRGGTLIYATCTLNPAENEDVCRRFLRHHPTFTSQPVLPGIPGLRSKEGFVTLMRHRSGTDGFFIAKFTHQSD